MSWPRRWLHGALLRRETGWRFALACGAAFALVQWVGHREHEMWRDELHCWAIGRDAQGLWDLLTGDRRYEGHPFLWYYLLHLVSRISRSYLALQVTGGALAVAAALLWLRYAPVPRPIRVALLGTYYLVYEYGVMSRGYTLGVLLVFVFCALYHPCRRRFVLLAGVLSLLGATSLYGTILAIALGGFLFSSALELERGSDGRRRVRVPLDWLSGVALLVGSLAFTFVTTWPPADALFARGAPGPVTEAVVEHLVAQYWRGMFPFSSVSRWNWLGNDSLFGQSPAGLRALPWLGAAWLMSCLVGLRRSPRLAATYLGGVVSMMAAQHTIYAGGWRHLGHHFILLVACVWLYAKQTRGRAPDRLLLGLFSVNVGILVLTGIAALRTDHREVFGGGTEAARYILDHHLEDHPIVAYPDPAMPVAIVLDRKVFIAVTGETADFIVLHSRRGGAGRADLLAHARRLALEWQRSALLVLDFDLGADPTPGLTTTLLHLTPDTIVNDERIWIYEVKVP